MGVHGLWKLLEPSGKPVPLESLENKVLAVDISIWLHQAIKGFQDSRGAAVPNAHILGVTHRLCKLLHYRIKPVFVFDGGVPALKHETIYKRNQLKARNQSDANSLQQKLMKILMKKAAVGAVLEENVASSSKPVIAVSSRTDDLFALPNQSQTSQEEESAGSGSESEESPTKQWNIHNIDEKSKEFLSLPADVRHEILTDLKETRKQSSWGRLHELPKQSDDFAVYQMNRLLKRYSIQSSLEKAEQEMGGVTLSIAQLENLLHEQGVNVQNWSNVGERIVSNENTRYLYIKDVKKALEKARLEQITEKNEENEVDDDLKAAIELSLQDVASTSKEEIADSSKNAITTKTILNDLPSTSKSSNDVHLSENLLEKSIESNKGKSEEEDDLQRAIALSLQDSQSDHLAKTSDGIVSSSQENYLDVLHDSEISSEISENEETINLEPFSAAKNYMMEYGGLTQAGVNDIFGRKTKQNSSSKLKQKKTVFSEEDTSSDDFLEVDSHLITENQQKEPIDNKISTNESKDTKSTVEAYKKTDQNLQIESQTEQAAVLKENKSESEDASSDDLVEVSETEITPKKDTKVMEICIDTKATLESDDLFSDIFNNEAEPKEELPKPAVAESLPVETTSFEEQKVDSTKEVTFYSNDSSKENKPEKLEIPKMSVQDLRALNDVLNQQTSDLVSEKSAKERLAVNISDQMYQDVQELLHLFGIPYILAPMEAEAQCAFLEQIELTHGTITDDSDVWLFGGKTVYKNFFNQDKQVLEYKSDRILKYFNLSRYELIVLAMLVGSDYTTGVPGIGPVTALEVLAAFPNKSPEELQPSNALFHEQLLSGMREFRKWILDGMGPGPRKSALRAKLKNIQLNEGFPNVAIVKAYLDPVLETDKGGFSWGKPDRTLLFEYACAKLGWSEKKCADLFDPVLARLNDTKQQSKIDYYFKKTHSSIASPQIVQEKMSKRVQAAVGRLGRKESTSEDSNDDLKQEKDTVKKTKRFSKRKTKEIEEQINKLIKAPSKVKRKICSKDQNAIDDAVKRSKANLQEVVHKKSEVIPQKQKDKEQSLKSKLKAIEVFRKSKSGPGYVKHKGKNVRKPKDDAELSESSSD